MNEVNISFIRKNIRGHAKPFLSEFCDIYFPLKKDYFYAKCLLKIFIKKSRNNQVFVLVESSKTAGKVVRKNWCIKNDI